MTMHPSYDEIINKLDQQQVWDFPGGIHPADRKELSNQSPIESLPIPAQLYVTVKQHIGVEGSIVVEPGQAVLKGQALTRSTNPYSVPVHAPTSGTITKVDKHPSPHPSGIPELTIQISTDGQDNWTDLSPMVDYQSHSKLEVLGKICDSGISGMGGAGFPSHIKLGSEKQVEFLIINGVECEPYISSDDRLMREHAWQIRQGIDVLSHLLSPKQVLIAIEDNKPEAIEAMQIACRENPLYRVCVVPTKYPAGGEKQLIQVLTNREVPAQGLPIDVGIIMHNVATCYALADAIFAGKPLIQRVTTVTGEAVGKASNYWALIGTPVEHILQHCDYQPGKQDDAHIIMGGPMMGFSVTDKSVPIIKTSNCLLVPSSDEMAQLNEQACIRCGACADVCPASLLPQQMYWHAKAKELDKVQEYNLFDCIECGACAYVCPSEIPLVHYYRVAKAEIKAEQEEKRLADKARERFEKRAARLKAEQAAREEKHRLAAEARKQAMQAKGSDAKDKIAAALARAKAKKQGSTTDLPQASSSTGANDSKQVVSETTDTNTAQQASKNKRVQAAIARAKAKKQAATDDANKTSEDTANKNEIDAESQQLVAKQPASNNARVQAAIARAKAKKAAAAEQQSAELKQNKAEETKQQTPEPTNLAKAETSRETEVHPAPAPDTGNDKNAEPTQQSSSTPDTPNIEQQPVQTAAEQKQARITAAVAKAKAKKLAEKNNQTSQPSMPASQPVKSSDGQEEQLAAKKRRIAAAVAKAKAKKQAEQAKRSTEDKS